MTLTVAANNAYSFHVKGMPEDRSILVYFESCQIELNRVFESFTECEMRILVVLLHAFPEAITLGTVLAYLETEDVRLITDDLLIEKDGYLQDIDDTCDRLILLLQIQSIVACLQSKLARFRLSVCFTNRKRGLRIVNRWIRSQAA